MALFAEEFHASRVGMVWMVAIERPRMQTGLTNRRAVYQAKRFRQCGGAAGGSVPIRLRCSIVVRSDDRAMEPAE
jgi:hypothetical protein